MQSHPTKLNSGRGRQYDRRSEVECLWYGCVLVFAANIYSAAGHWQRHSQHEYYIFIEIMSPNAHHMTIFIDRNSPKRPKTVDLQSSMHLYIVNCLCHWSVCLPCSK